MLVASKRTEELEGRGSCFLGASVRGCSDGMEDIDLSSLQRAEPRLLTQQAGRIAFELGYAGLFYHSRYGHSIENWAIFEDWTMSERFSIHQPNSRKVTEDDPDLLEAPRILGIVIGD
jgi:hypothetical protein